MLETLIGDIEATGYHSVYRYQDIIVSLKVDTRVFIEFASMYFDGYFDVCAHLEPQITVYASSNPFVLKYLCRELPVDKKDLDKNGSIVMPLSSNMDVIFQQERDIEKEINCFAYYVVDKSKRNITVLVPESEEAGKYVPMRAVRIIVKLLLLERGMLSFHSACIVRNGYGVGLIGDKFSGKTTTLINALLNCNCDFLANDQVFLDYTKGTLMMYGLPISAGIRIGTIHYFSPLQSLLSKGPELHCDNNILDAKELKDPRTRIYVSPRQLVSILKCSIVPCARIGCFVVPEFSRDISESKLASLTKDEARKCLLKHYLSEPFPNQPYWNTLVTPDNRKLHGNVEKIIDRMSNDLTVYKLMQNDRTNGDSADILNTLM